MKEIKPLVRGLCPICNKTIMNQTKSAYINGGMDFWVQFSDGSKAQFAICFDCFEVITQEQINDIMQSQILNWGQEIYNQLNWYITKAVNLKITKWVKTKDALTITDK